MPSWITFSEYDNYRGAGGHITSDAESDFAHEDDSEVKRLDSKSSTIQTTWYISDIFENNPRINTDYPPQVGGVLDELSLENIRQISKNITTKFGATRSEKDECDSDAVVWASKVFQHCSLQCQ